MNWNNNNAERYGHITVPHTTMHRYMHQIMSHPNLNIQKSMSKKIESRSCVKWSIQSAISYMCVVLAIYFICAEPSEFHPQSKSSDPEVEELNNEVLHIKSINSHVQQFIPVLPHLLTSTD